MKIYGLSGKSGTGKSYNAGELCGRMHIPAIIDDGLYIYGSSIAAAMAVISFSMLFLQEFRQPGVGIVPELLPELLNFLYIIRRA